MRIHIRHSVRPTPSAGDIKTSKQGTFIREQVKYNGMFCVNRGKPVYHWVRTGDAPEGFKGRAIINYKG